MNFVYFKRIVKNKYFKYFLVLIWMLIIFKFSADPASVSDGKSGFVIRVLNSIGIDLNSAFGKWANFAVRKSAHFMEYFVLCILLLNALKVNFNLKKAIILSILITFLYACSDEFHQLFVSGREGRIRDVFIDASGGVTFLLIYMFYLVVKMRVRPHGKKNYEV